MISQNDADAQALLGKPYDEVPEAHGWIKLAQRIVLLIEPDPALREDCLTAAYDHILDLCGEDWDRNKDRDLRCKETRATARRVVDALVKAKHAARELSPTITYRILLPDLDAHLKPLIEAYVALANYPPLPRQRADGERKREAARRALSLLTRFRRPAPLTAGGTFSSITGLIYGKPDANFDYICRQVKKNEAERGLE